MKSDPEVPPQYVGVGLDLTSRSLMHDMAVVDDVGALCKGESRG
jgi:hypothetical protein